MDQNLGKRIIAIKKRIAEEDFNEGHWREIGVLAGERDVIESHHRLLRSLRFGDDDYEGNVLEVLTSIADHNLQALQMFEQYLDDTFSVDPDSEYVSSMPAERRITFAPTVFVVPDATVEDDLVSVMMPFDSSFSTVYKAIKKACESSGFRCLRADDIWEESVVVQDIFNLVFRSRVVVVDFTGKNPNVMYETGIAHTLGKQVIPITQSAEDVPFDLRHHRYVNYLNNGEGRSALTETLQKRLRHIGVPEFTGF